MTHFSAWCTTSHEDLVEGVCAGRICRQLEWREDDERALTELEATATIQPYEKELFRKDGGRVPVLVGAALFEERGRRGRCLRA